MGGGFADLLIAGLILLEDTDQSLDGPHLVGTKLGLDERDGIGLGGLHYAAKYARDFIKNQALF